VKRKEEQQPLEYSANAIRELPAIPLYAVSRKRKKERERERERKKERKRCALAFNSRIIVVGARRLCNARADGYTCMCIRDNKTLCDDHVLDTLRLVAWMHASPRALRDLEAY